MAKIAYTDKSKTGTGAVKQWRDVDANEVKASVNALYDQFIVDQYTARDNVTVADTTTETNLIGDGNGTLTIQPSQMLKGTYIQLRSYGYLNTASTGRESTLRIKFGGVELIESVGTLPASLEEVAITMNAIIKVVSDVGVTLAGYTLIQGKSGSGIATVSMRSLNKSKPIKVDMSVPCLIEHTYQWTTASPDNSITITNFEVLIK